MLQTVTIPLELECMSNKCNDPYTTAVIGGRAEIQCNPNRDYSEVCPIGSNGTYSQVNWIGIAALINICRRKGNPCLYSVPIKNWVELHLDLQFSHVATNEKLVAARLGLFISHFVH